MDLISNWNQELITWWVSNKFRSLMSVEGLYNRLVVVVFFIDLVWLRWISDYKPRIVVQVRGTWVHKINIAKVIIESDKELFIRNTFDIRNQLPEFRRLTTCVSFLFCLWICSFQSIYSLKKITTNQKIHSKSYRLLGNNFSKWAYKLNDKYLPI